MSLEESIPALERFEIRERLGRGGMGSVYRVYDRRRGVEVAMKSVGEVEGDALLRFKREFRVLRDLRHPNLIRLGELFEEDGVWFYTMELLEGDDFLSYVRGALPEEARADTASVGCDVERLRDALGQLVRAVAALHRASQVHRDIKPANVMITTAGRVVLLDMGLVTEIADGRQATDVGTLGSYGYMAPEQAQGRPIDASADWYSVGAMVYEALTGRLPFDGPAVRVLVRKMTEDAPRASSLVRGVPPDLDELVAKLLARQPADRPSVETILEATRGYATWSGLGPEDPRDADSGELFVGRARELAFLRRAAARIRWGENAAILVHGESGIGKSALVRHFVSELAAELDEPWILRGRCSRRESMPFQSFDGVVDSLSSRLRLFPRDVLTSLLPPHAEFLSRAFPVLRRIPAFPSATARDARDPREQRAMLFDAMRSLFSSLGAERPLVLVLEDLQWLDPDSRALIAELLRPPEAPPILFVATLRTEGSAHRVPVAEPFPGVAVERLGLEPLTGDDARLLARRLATAFGRDSSASAEWIVAESAGHPLFLAELVRHGARRADEAPLALDEVIEERVSHVGAKAEQLLRLVSIAGRPPTSRLLAEAAGDTLETVEAELDALRTSRLVKLVVEHGHEAIDVYHDRIREALLGRLPIDDRKELHLRLARAYEALPSPDPIDLATHYGEAGHPERAAAYFETAGDRASLALAFDRAALLYRRAIDVRPHPYVEIDGLSVKLGRALANAGRGEEAAEEFLAAGEEATGIEAIELRSQAAAQLVLTGHFDRGASVYEATLKSLGEPYHRSALRALVSVVWTRILLLFVRGGRPRDESELPPLERLRADILQTAGVALGSVRAILAADLLGRARYVAEVLGEPGRMARVLAYDAASMAVTSQRFRERRTQLFRRAMRLAEDVGRPEVVAVVHYCEGMGAYLGGRWSKSLEHLGIAERIFQEQVADVPAERRTLQGLRVFLLFELGRYREFRARASRARLEARERGDRFTQLFLNARLLLLLACMDDTPSEGAESASELLREWGAGADEIQVHHCVGLADVDCYEGRCDGALDRFEARLRRVRTFTTTMIQRLRIDLAATRGMLAVAQARVSPERRGKLLSIALASARRLERERELTATAPAHLVRAAVASVKGQEDIAIRHLEAAVEVYEQAEMRGRAIVARRRLGQLLGGRRGAEMVEQSDAWLRNEGIRRPDRFARMMAPGFPDDTPAVVPDAEGSGPERANRLVAST